MHEFGVYFIKCLFAIQELIIGHHQCVQLRARYTERNACIQKPRLVGKNDGLTAGVGANGVALQAGAGGSGGQWSRNQRGGEGVQRRPPSRAPPPGCGAGCSCGSQASSRLSKSPTTEQLPTGPPGKRLHGRVPAAPAAAPPGSREKPL